MVPRAWLSIPVLLNRGLNLGGECNVRWAEPALEVPIHIFVLHLKQFLVAGLPRYVIMMDLNG